MFAQNFASYRHRRGVVLVVVLGMLGLLALVGVTFATFSGQAQIGARNFSQSLQVPKANDVFDWGLSQLINDTDNPLSAIRGHSLKRDMYGNDSSYAIRDVNGNVLSYESNGYLSVLPNGEQLYILPNGVRSNPGTLDPKLGGFPQLRTNIPITTTASFIYPRCSAPTSRAGISAPTPGSTRTAVIMPRKRSRSSMTTSAAAITGEPRSTRSRASMPRCTC